LCACGVITCAFMSGRKGKKGKENSRERRRKRERKKERTREKDNIYRALTLACIKATRAFGMCDMTRSNVQHDAFIYVTRRIHLCNVTEAHLDTAKEPYKRDYILQKRPKIFVT